MRAGEVEFEGWGGQIWRLGRPNLKGWGKLNLEAGEAKFELAG